MSETADGPVARSIGTAFAVLTAAVVVLAAAWAASNWQIVPPDRQAVVLRFGRIVSVRPSGLVTSWPRPVGRVVLVPGGQRLLTVDTVTTARPGGLVDSVSFFNGNGIPEGSGAYLTGDGGVVLMRAKISYRVTDAAAYLLAETHVVPALRRVFEAASVHVLAARSLDDVMVAEPVQDRDDAERAAQAMARRDALRGDLAAEMNRRLAPLGLGVEVARVDPDATLPLQAKQAYEQVLVAAQMAQQGLADARTAAVQTKQAADRERDRLLEAAKAAAAERVSQAQSQTASILAVQSSLQPQTRDAVLERIYLDQLAAVLPKVGRMTAVDMSGGTHVILPGVAPGTGGAP